MLRNEAAPLTEPRGAAAPAARAADRLRAMVAAHTPLVWRALRRLGVPEAHADDGTQQVFMVAMERLDDIAIGSEKSFLFGTAMRVAARIRRTQGRRREDLGEPPVEREDAAPSPEELLDARRARAALDRILDGMSDEVRAVFFLFELEGMTMAQIAHLLDVPPGTVASRLRRGREYFAAEATRLREGRGAR